MMEQKSIMECGGLAHHGVASVMKGSNSNFLGASGDGGPYRTMNHDIKLVKKKEIARV